MHPKKYLQWFAGNVSKRSGISRVTIETVMPYIFDEIRRELTEGTRCVPIEAFGTFFVKEYPERQRRYTYKGRNEIITTPAHPLLKFSPSTTFKREVEAGTFDTTHQSFRRNEGERPLRSRIRMKYQPSTQEIHIHAITSKKEGQSEQEPTE